MKPHLAIVLMQFLCSFNRAPTYLLCNASIRTLMHNMYPGICSPTIEHCVPKSFLKPNETQKLSRDMHAIICLPQNLNSMRSNYRLICDDTSDKQWARNDKKRLFSPPVCYRGPYARSIGYFVITYPSYVSTINKHVMDLELILDWSDTYPCTHKERIVHATIASIQSNENPFVTEPDEAKKMVLTLMSTLGTAQRELHQKQNKKDGKRDDE